MTPILAEIIAHINQIEAVCQQQAKRIVELEAELASIKAQERPYAPTEGA